MIVRTPAVAAATYLPAGADAGTEAGDDAAAPGAPGPEAGVPGAEAAGSRGGIGIVPPTETPPMRPIGRPMPMPTEVQPANPAAKTAAIDSACLALISTALLQAQTVAATGSAPA
ncbi:MAG: hypothetical protein HZC37_06210 [Burkholderiales bacterium]|nr:hypothetical protein [Burkholderiales bacterium]